MATLKQPGCNCPAALVLSLSYSGGDAGLSELVALNGGSPITVPANVSVTFDAFTRRDSLGVDAWLSVGGPMSVIATGCIDGSASASVTIPAGATHLAIIVTPNCDPSQTTPPTAWDVSIEVEEVRCP